MFDPSILLSNVGDIILKAYYYLSDNKGIWSYIAIPFVNAFIGWFTNVIAVKMMFYPIEPWGWPPYFGWQGVVSAKSKKMIGMAIDLIENKLLTVGEVFSKIDPQQIAEEIREPMNLSVETMIQETFSDYSPTLWESLPQFAKKRIRRMIKKNVPNTIVGMMSEIRMKIEDLFDVRSMVFETLDKDKSLLNSMVSESGDKEIKFVEMSGLYLGFLFGLPMIAIWYYWPIWWILPVGGTIVGYATNWVALKLIFEPQSPVKFGPWTIQGLFLKRQQEVAKVYGRLVADNIFRPDNILNSILHGPHADKIEQIIRRHVNIMVDDCLGLAKPFVLMIVGIREFNEMKEKAYERLAAEYPKTVAYMYRYTRDALDVENTVRTKFSDLTSEEFIGILRPAFQEEETKLILAGAALGFGAGCVQLLLPF